MRACIACAYEAADDFAFCPRCGARLPAAAPAGDGLGEERRVVTTLFCDLVGFTALSEAHDHEIVDALLRAYAACARGIIEAHGGVVEKFIGDAAVAVFGLPRAHDDDPERAVLAGLRLAAGVPRLEWPGDAPLAVRVGVTTGETFVRTGVDPAAGETFLTGDAVNTAARLQTSAPAGAVVVGELTHALIVKTFATEPLKPLSLKGKAEPVAAWRVVAPVSRTGRRTSGESSSPFLGREAELATLRDAFEAARRTGVARSVLVVGEPGVGKSRLVLELSRGLDEGPHRPVWRQGRCPAYGDALGLSALADVLKAHAGILDSEPGAAVEAKLDAVLPAGEDGAWLRRHLRPLLGLGTQEASAEENHAAWWTFLELVAARDPAVVVFEDLHWAGVELLAFLGSPGRRLEAPLLVIGTARPELLERDPGFGEAFAGPSLLTLTTLDGHDAGAIAAELLGGGLAPETTAAIVTRTGGNPLYVEEYARLLADRGLLGPAPGGLEIADLAGAQTLPDSLQGVIGARLDLLSPRSRATLGDAAVLGEAFWLGGVAALGDGDRRSAADELGELVQKSLVRPAEHSSLAGEDEYVFWHALVRDVAYARLPHKVRSARHAAAAAWVEQTAGDRALELADVLAHHYATAFELASELRDPAGDVLREPACRYLGLAGEQAESLDAAAAEAYYGRAIALAPEGGAGRCRLLARHAAVARRRGRLAEAAAGLRSAASGLLAAGDRRAAAAVLADLGEVLVDLDDADAPRFLREALELICGDAPSPEMLRVLVIEAWKVADDEGPSEGLERAERVIELAGSLGVAPPVEALDLRARMLCTLGEAAGLDELRRLAAAAAREGRRVDEAAVLGELAWCEVSFEGPAGSLRTLEAVTGLARRSHLEHLADGSRALATRSLYWAGEWDRALAECEALAPVLEGRGDAFGLAMVRYVWSLVLLGRGDGLAAKGLSEKALQVARGNPIRGVSAVYLVAAAAARHAAGGVDAAVDLLEECREVLRDKGETMFVYLLPLAVRTAVGAGRPDLARSLAGLVVPLLPFSAHVEASVRAQVAEADGGLEQAAAGYADAAARWQGFGMPYEEACARAGCGRCLASLGRGREAAPELERARTLFEALQAGSSVGEVDELLGTIDAAG